MCIENNSSVFLEKAKFDDLGYQKYLELLNESIYGLSEHYRFFHSDVKYQYQRITILWDTFLKNIPEEYRQRLNCNTCKWFVVNWGDLVYIDPETYDTKPVVFSEKPFISKYNIEKYGKDIEWRDVCSIIADSMYACFLLIKNAKVNHPFLLNRAVSNTIGSYQSESSPAWHHMYGKISHFNSFVDDNNSDTDDYEVKQITVEISESMKTLVNTIHSTKFDTFKIANTFIQHDILERTNKYKKMMNSLCNLVEKMEGEKNIIHSTNMCWLYVCNYSNYCRSLSSMIGNLLENIEDGMYEDLIKGRKQTHVTSR